MTEPIIPRPMRRASIISDPIAPDVAQLAAMASDAKERTILPPGVLSDLVRAGTPPVDMTAPDEHGALQHSIDKLDTIDMDKELRTNRIELGKAVAEDFAKSTAAWQFDLDLGLNEADVNPWAYSGITNAVFKVGDFLTNLAGSVLPASLSGSNLVASGPQPRRSIPAPGSAPQNDHDHGHGEKVWVRRNIMGSFENTVEHSESPQDLQAKIGQLVEMIKQSEYVVVFTGAGVSTGCGIPDYRGPNGVWTSRAKGLPEPKMPSPADVKPGMSHRCINKLYEAGLVKFVVTQNVDGLHLRSGLPSTHLAELHGCFNLERCTECRNVVYIRNKDKRVFPTRSSEDHDVGRRCRACKAPMRDTMVQFGEAMPRVPLHAAQSHTQLADLFLVLGSSLSVYPAHTLPRHVTERGKQLCIVNYQQTAFDDLANLRIFADTVTVLQGVCEGLGIDPGEFVDIEDDLMRDNAGMGWEPAA